MIFLFDFTLLVIDIHHIMLISLFPAPFDHFHFHPTLGLDPALILSLRLMKSITSLILQQGSIVVTSPQLLLLCQTSSLTSLPSSHDPSTTGLCESILSSSNYDDKNLFNQNDIFRFPQALWHGAHFQRIYSCFSFVIPISCHRNSLL